MADITKETQLLADLSTLINPFQGLKLYLFDRFIHPDGFQLSLIPFRD